MPKNSFFRLDEARREEISNSAMHLFVDNLYEDITMKMVLDCLSMHPGTFYRYFEDKDDLYCLLIRNVTQKRAAYFNSSNEDSLFQFFLNGLFGNVNGIVTEPLNELEIKLTKTFLYIPENILLKVYLNVLKGESSPLIKGILRRMRVDGYLRPDIDDDLISFMFESMQFNLVMFFREFDIKDSKLQHKISKYFADFMGHGLLEDHKYSEMVSDLKKAKE
ncbi:TetR/AcrR family transcriptional regulator [Paenibacillus chitinolyticus]|uniref:TetR/AcrR family transcriptional regulator n=1 Tax=Paenibacillus chitinolyticus TaxID=79263 RepID=A0A410WXZ3_9BACL|nr:TetR/AcrR family transcriptional regulator [Paenibacillus chitinolyticus]MCY9589909.1 TetR/AcrR family transcriptional regulator [Paenibacillus chitinolyticus]MCY9596246.1 TetR/AcrR family transcriptional regulator [Paenibacillus chitinolyticus]QAV19278.1 TetR/AcrR family transcriptional regulator [Paenibacillus chitinolyticus]